MMFQQALSHCRHKTTLKNTLQKININAFSSCLTFEDIFAKVETICAPVRGIGTLSMYDISTDIAQLYGLEPSRIYCIGDGPRTALKVLGVTPRNKKLGTRTIPSTTIAIVQEAFKQKGYPIPKQIQTSTNPDDWESFLCNWQKQFKSGSATAYHNPQHCTCTGTLNLQDHI